MKKLIAISALALVMITGAKPPFGTSAQAKATVEQVTQETQVTQVRTAPGPKVSGIVKVEATLYGPVKVTALKAGPIVETGEPVMGSMEWLAREKAEKDKIQSDAISTEEKLKAKIARLERIAQDTKELNQAVHLVKKQVGKTWYAFSGSTPNGWDCSGLVLWMYGKIGYTLEHRASLQKNSGELVEEPKIGDIVAFTYKGYDSAYHVGIYVGPNEMIHAGGKRGDKTEIVSISQWAKGNGNTVVTYTRVIETNN
jgi:cell wall-associated NlpC family hydrolase